MTNRIQTTFRIQTINRIQSIIRIQTIGRIQKWNKSFLIRMWRTLLEIRNMDSASEKATIGSVLQSKENLDFSEDSYQDVEMLDANDESWEEGNTQKETYGYAEDDFVTNYIAANNMHSDPEENHFSQDDSADCNCDDEDCLEYHGKKKDGFYMRMKFDNSKKESMEDTIKRWSPKCKEESNKRKRDWDSDEDGTDGHVLKSLAIEEKDEIDDTEKYNYFVNKGDDGLLFVDKEEKIAIEKDLYIDLTKQPMTDSQKQVIDNLENFFKRIDEVEKKNPNYKWTEKDEDGDDVNVYNSPSLKKIELTKASDQIPRKESRRKKDWDWVKQADKNRKINFKKWKKN